jgi:hypothetical protein
MLATHASRVCTTTADSFPPIISALLVPRHLWKVDPGTETRLLDRTRFLLKARISVRISRIRVPEDDCGRDISYAMNEALPYSAPQASNEWMMLPLGLLTIGITTFS